MDVGFVWYSMGCGLFDLVFAFVLLICGWLCCFGFVVLVGCLAWLS